MRSLNQKIFLINLIVILAALIVWRVTNSIETRPVSPLNSASNQEVKSSLLIGFGLLFSLVVLVQIYLHRTITRPIRSLARDLRSRANSGQLTPVTVNGRDEIAQLAELFNALQKKVKYQVDDLRCFADNVCHEIRTPLASIVSAIEFMERKNIYREDLALVIKSEALRLGLIATALLETTSGFRPISRSDVDCEEIFQQAVAANGIGYRVQVVSHGSKKNIAVDPVLIRQVFENLLSNAKKFATERSIIKANFNYLENKNRKNLMSLIFTLSNEGPFVPENQLTRVFDRFFSTDKSHAKGYGIGLSLCRDIIEAHTGSIRIENLATGGVVAIIELPW